MQPAVIVTGAGSITIPCIGPTTMSQFALEACAGCLWQEPAPHHVAVSIVEPGAVATAIGDKGQTGTLRRPGTWRRGCRRRSSMPRHKRVVR